MVEEVAELQSASVSDQLAVTQSGGLSRLLVLMFDLLLYFFFSFPKQMFVWAEKPLR